jgi:hypothetical protein
MFMIYAAGGRGNRRMDVCAAKDEGNDGKVGR